MEEKQNYFELSNMNIGAQKLYEDFMFKKSMKDTLVLEAFLKEVLGKENVGCINPNIIEDYKLHEVKDGHFITCDLVVRDDRNSIFIIENQNYQVSGFINRMEFQSQLSSINEYTTKNYPNPTYDYASFPKIYCIWIWNKNPFNSCEGFIEFTKQSKQVSTSLYPIQRQVILSRDCLDTIQNPNIKDFLAFMNEPTKENALHSKWPMLRLLQKRFEYLIETKEGSDELMIGYDDMMYYQSLGREVGIKEGIKENKVEIIKNMDKEQFDVKCIAKVVKMSVEDVCRILEKPISA